MILVEKRHVEFAPQCNRCIVVITDRGKDTMKDKLENLSTALILIGLLLAMNENTSKMYINIIGAGFAVLGMLILHVTGKDS